MGLFHCKHRKVFLAITAEGRQTWLEGWCYNCGAHLERVNKNSEWMEVKA